MVPGPPGELYGGAMSRTLEVGQRSDSRISFHVVQLVAHGSSPYSDVGRSYFHPWSFSDRGPLAGLVAAPLVLISGASVPQTMPDQPWSPFDREGFAAYRLAMSALAVTCLTALFALDHGGGSQHQAGGEELGPGEVHLVHDECGGRRSFAPSPDWQPWPCRRR